MEKSQLFLCSCDKLTRNLGLTQQTLQERTLSTALRAPLVRARLTRAALADLETKGGKPNASMRPFKNYEESAMNLASGSVGGILIYGVHRAPTPAQSPEREPLPSQVFAGDRQVLRGRHSPRMRRRYWQIPSAGV